VSARRAAQLQLPAAAMFPRRNAIKSLISQCKSVRAAVALGVSILFSIASPASAVPIVDGRFDPGDPIPEPATMSLLALGGVVLLLRPRR